jgi:hypothetical protein
MEYYDFEPDVKIDSDLGLDCPKIGRANLHQVGYRICARDACADTIRVTAVHAKRTSAPITTKEIPITDYPLVPGERQWIEIDFACEQCGCVPSPVDPSRYELNLDAPTPGHTLIIYQHKGLTLMHWYDRMTQGSMGT